MEKTEELGIHPIGKLLAKYSLPAVIAMLVNAIYNVVDRIFIAQFAGEKALAGLTIAFPVMLILFAFASLVGAGGAALMSIRFGEKDARGTSHVFGNMLSVGIIITAITVIILSFNLKAVLNAFGATSDVLGFSTDYMRIILYGFIFQMMSFTLSGSVRTEGQPILSMLSMIVSAVTNIVLDFLFIGVFGWGVQGAALATVAGQLVGLIILISFYLSGKSVLQLRLKDFKPDWNVFSKILIIGFSTFMGTVGTSISMAFLNRGLVAYGGTAAIASMGAINSLFTLFFMPLMGVQQGMQPIIGYNHGARLNDRVYKTLKIGILVGIIFSTIVFALLEIFPVTFISLFLDPSSATVQTAVTGLRIYVLMLPLLCINVFGIVFYQSTARGGQAFVLGLLRQVLFLIPAVLIMQNLFGLIGVWASVPVSDALAIIVTSIALIITYRKESKKTEVLTSVGQEIITVEG
jgi:putative MATE family efflux protein